MERETVAFTRFEIGGAKDIPYYLGGTTILYGSSIGFSCISAPGP
jgi:hypothetical protein